MPLLRVNTPKYSSASVRAAGSKSRTRFGSLTLVHDSKALLVGEVFEADNEVAAKLLATDPPMAVEASERDILNWCNACRQRGNDISAVAFAAEKAVIGKTAHVGRAPGGNAPGKPRGKKSDKPGAEDSET